MSTLALFVAVAALAWAGYVRLQLGSVATMAATAKVELDIEKARLSYAMSVLTTVLFICRHPERLGQTPGALSFDANLVKLMYPELDDPILNTGYNEQGELNRFIGMVVDKLAKEFSEPVAPKTSPGGVGETSAKTAT